MSDKDKIKVMKVNTFKFLALEYMNKLVDEDKLRNTNITSIYFDTIKKMVNNKELINIQILGNVSSSKSTVMFLHLLFGNGLLGKSTSINNICADQVEFSRELFDFNNVFIGIDEWNPLGETGLNSTVDSKFLNYYSDVCAQLFVHRVSCSPKKVSDDNATIILEVLGKEISSTTTRCLVYYRTLKNNYTNSQLIGFTDFDVSPAINNPHYITYRDRKFKKMRLVLKEGIKDIRDFEWAEIILYVLKKLSPLTKLMNVTTDIIANYVEMAKKENKSFNSLITDEDLIRKLSGVLKVSRSYFNTLKSMQKKQALINSGKVSNANIKLAEQEIREIKIMLETLKESNIAMYEYYENILRIKSDYKK